MTENPTNEPAPSLEIEAKPPVVPATAEEVAALQAQVAEMQRAQAAAKVAESLGGAEVVEQAKAWAQNNLTQEQIDAVNSDLASASPEGQAAIMRDLVQRSGVTPSAEFAAGTVAQSATQPFSGPEALHAAQRDPRYKTDADYREEILRRLSASNF